MGLIVGQRGGSANRVNLKLNFLPEIQSFLGKPEEVWIFMEAYKIQSNNLDRKIGYYYWHIAIENVAFCFNDVKVKC